MIWWETDARAIARAVQNAAAAGDLIDHGTARAIASGYNEPGIVADFCTSGALSADADALFDAITDHGHYLRIATDTDRAALEALRAYLADREDSADVTPVSGWPEMWAVRHVDYPHAGIGDLYDCPPCDAIRADSADPGDHGQEPAETGGGPPGLPAPPGSRLRMRAEEDRVVAELRLTVSEHRTDRVTVTVEVPERVAGDPATLRAFLNRHPRVWLEALPAMVDDIPVTRRTVDDVDLVSVTRKTDTGEGTAG